MVSVFVDLLNRVTSHEEKFNLEKKKADFNRFSHHMTPKNFPLAHFATQRK